MFDQINTWMGRGLAIFLVGWGLYWGASKIPRGRRSTELRVTPSAYEQKVQRQVRKQLQAVQDRQDEIVDKMRHHDARLRQPITSAGR